MNEQNLYPHLRKNGLVWGCATASFQIEGGSDLHKKLPSIWDVFCAQPKKIKDNSDGRVACNHVHTYPQDIALLADLGFTQYRFSLAWTRLVDEHGKINAQGLDFYQRLLACLAKHNVTPHITLNHWDLPAHLQGGWLSRDTAYRFAEYAQLVAAHLADMLPLHATVSTHNEPWCIAFLGYDRGVHAPGITDRPSSIIAAHHLMLAHGLGLQAWRATCQTTRLGIVLNPELADAATISLQDVYAADMAMQERNEVFLNPLFGFSIPKAIVQQLQGANPYKDGDAAICAQPLDYLGINYYTRSMAAAPKTPAEKARGYALVAPSPDPKRQKVTDIGWEIYPNGLVRILTLLQKNWPLPPIYITENGAADNTPVAENGTCEDTLRLTYLQAHLQALDEACQKGIDVRGYFAWSLLDNFEWAEGYTQRFGIVHVDYATQKRTPKASALWLRSLLKT